MYLRLTPDIAICSPWHPCWPRRGQKLAKIYYSRTFPINHPSTILCLDLLTSACRTKSFSSVLDVGCGSGILALAGAMLGIPFNVGCDLSGAAMHVSRENARRLHLEGRTEWLQGSTEALLSSFHLIVANLPFALQKEKITELVRLSDRRGGIILAGFRDVQEREIIHSYNSCGWQVQRRLTRDMWELELPAEKSFTWVGLYLNYAD